jgi:hypothetical protein
VDGVDAPDELLLLLLLLLLLALLAFSTLGSILAAFC